MTLIFILRRRKLMPVLGPVLVALFLSIFSYGGIDGTGVALASVSGEAGLSSGDPAITNQGRTEQDVTGSPVSTTLPEIDLSIASPPPGITVNGKAWAPEGAFVTAGVLLAPFEATCKVLGVRGFTDDLSGVMRAHRPGTMLQMAFNSLEISVNGVQTKLLVPPVKKGVTVFIPVRAFAEGLGCQVTWDASTASVAIELPKEGQSFETSRGGGIDREEESWVVSCTEEEIDLLARVVNAEAGNEPMEGQVAVAAVVINRVRSPQYPNSIDDVIRQPGQFKVIENGRYKEATGGTGREAALAALRGEDPSLGALYFFNPKIATSSFLFKRTVTVNIGSHRFAK
jgi:hypothetical protein